MQPLIERDYFTDYEILKDPYAYFEAVRQHGPVFQPPGKDYLVVTGFEETLEILRNNEDFSAIIGLQGAALPLPFEPHGSDITDQIEAHRGEIIGGDLLVNLDDDKHTQMRSLVNRLFTPSKLKKNEEFIAAYSDELVRNAVADGGCELIKTIATPFVTLVIADLLGVPADDRQRFMDAIAAAPPPGSLEGNEQLAENHPFMIMAGYFVDYINDRRARPREDILTEFAQAKYPNGEEPELMDLVQTATFLFGAGQDTSAKLLGTSMKYITEVPGLQVKLRADPSLIPDFLEEVLRLEGSTKQTARLARHDTRIGDLHVPAGTKVLVALSAANRDSARWVEPVDLKLDRPKSKEHVGFGRGKHVCAGAPLARVEVRVILERFFEHTSNIDLDETKHGPRGNRELDYEPSFIIRGLSELHVKLTPSSNFPGRPENSLVGTDAEATPEQAAAPAEARFSVESSTIAELLADPAAAAVLDRHFPGVTTDKRIGMAKRMTLKAVQKFAPGQFSDESLAALNKSLAEIG
ncbi:cytochrome P450 [Novosphingobium endophyticum]|uniref:Cytochrome P450 n=1 Tax=Novosphingobium endophyticum TaxID=1955250 RepID=A0A916X5I5_9SPHN|nr:cytochrome P450 [Novosphingobium endophyticum]GGC00895.1 cytochrome P450 [Novosphingobium endophyticum]